MGWVKTVNGSRRVGTSTRRLEIQGRSVWHGDAVAMATRTEPGIAGLLPLSLFKMVYVCNSQSYIILE